MGAESAVAAREEEGEEVKVEEARKEGRGSESGTKGAEWSKCVGSPLLVRPLLASLGVDERRLARGTPWPVVWPEG